MIMVLSGAALAAAVGDWIAVGRRRRRLEHLLKPATLGLLIAVAVLLDPDSESQRAWFVGALFLSLAGDIFLMLPERFFVAGLGSFLLAHVAYIGGFWGSGEDLSERALLVGAAATLAAGLVLGRIVVRGARARSPQLAVPVFVYVVAISMMVISAVGTKNPAAIAGAGLFYISDTLIAWNRFVGAISWAPVAIMITYHLAQGGLVLSLVV